jgi:hypothetical protein
MKKMQVNSPEYRNLVSELLGKEVKFETEQGSYIFRPTNEALTAMAVEYGITVELLQRIIELLKLSDNLVAAKNNCNKGYLTMDNRERFSFNPKTFELNRIKVSKVVEQDSNIFVYINGFPLSSSQDRRIKEEVAKTLLSTQKLDVLNKDTLEIILASSTANDVTNLCQTNANFRRLCNDPSVFRRLMDKFYPNINHTSDPKKQFYFLTETAKKYDQFKPIITKSYDTLYIRLLVQNSQRQVGGSIHKDYKNNIIADISTSSWSGTSPEVAKNLGHAYIALGEIVEQLRETFPNIPDNFRKYIPTNSY